MQFTIHPPSVSHMESHGGARQPPEATSSERAGRARVPVQEFLGRRSRGSMCPDYGNVNFIVTRIRKNPV